MKFEEFVQKVSPKIGAKGAFDLARDARITAVEKVLIEGGQITRESLEKALAKELEDLVTKIEFMPNEVKKI